MNTPEIAFLKKHPKYAFHTISLFYPLEGEMLRKYRNVLYWEWIYENTAIDWSVGIVQTFLTHFKDGKGKLNSALHYNERLPWSVDFIKQFETLWYWDLLGEREYIQNDPLIQEAFKKYLEPVNAWIDSIEERYPVKDNSTNKNESSHVTIFRHYTPEEIELNRGEINWFYFSVDPNACDWTLDILNTYENYFDYDGLIGNRGLWEKCFGKLSYADIESILGDKELYAKAAEPFPQPDLSEYDELMMMIPKELTYEYFLKSYLKYE